MKEQIFTKLTTYFQGKHTMFVVFSLAIGVGMSLIGKLNANLVTLILGLQGAVFAHSVKEDYFDKKV
jgi:hypothetical protein